jgi:hypothetical protein
MFISWVQKTVLMQKKLIVLFLKQQEYVNAEVMELEDLNFEFDACVSLHSLRM